MLNGLEKEAAVKTVIEKYKPVHGALLPVLKEVQAIYGFLPAKVQVQISKELRIPLSEVSEMVSYYSLLQAEQMGETVIRICDSASCHISGSVSLKEALEAELGIQVGETTDDGKYTLLTCGCLGACDRAPAVMIHDVIYGPISVEHLKDFLVSIERKEIL